MKQTENPEVSVLTPRVQVDETGSLKAAEPGSTYTGHSESIAPVHEAEREDLIGFFAIGIVINIILVSAYFIWAYRQLKKKRTE